MTKLHYQREREKGRARETEIKTGKQRRKKKKCANSFFDFLTHRKTQSYRETETKEEEEINESISCLIFNLNELSICMFLNTVCLA